MTAFNEFTVESAALAWLSELGWQAKYGAKIARGELFAERQDYGQVVLEQRLRDALVRLNPDLLPETLQDAFRKLTRPEGATLEQRNRVFHRMLVDA
jgi:type I restriction enzyme R subunit